MVSSLTFALGLLALPLAAAGRTRPAPRSALTSRDLTGSGTIQVLVGTGGNTNGTTDFSTTTPADAVGCLDAAGKVTLNDCATFSVNDTYYTSSSGGGICSFRNSSQPANTDAVYGHNVYALACWDHAPVLGSDVQFYNMSGLDYNFIGQGDVDLYYDIPGLPEADEDALDIWYFVWGSEQRDVPSGHYKALLLWEATS